MRVLADDQLFMRAFPKAPRCTSAAYQRNDRPHFITHNIKWTRPQVETLIKPELLHASLGAVLSETDSTFCRDEM